MMKTIKTVWKQLSVVLLLFITTSVVILYSCEKENINPINSANDMQTKSGKPIPYDIIAGKTPCGPITIQYLVGEKGSKYGEVYTFNDAKNFYLYVIALKGYSLGNSYLFTGLRHELPLNADGDIDNRLFNHILHSEDFVRSRGFRVPLKQMQGISVVSLMVNVRNNFANLDSQGEIQDRDGIQAWAEGKKIGTISIGDIFTYKKGVCLVNEPVSVDQRKE